MNLEVRRKVLRAFELLTSEWVHDHMEGLNLLDEARTEDPAEVAKIEAAVDKEIEVTETTVLE